jgi:hypothetical protein
VVSRETPTPFAPSKWTPILPSLSKSNTSAAHLRAECWLQFRNGRRGSASRLRIVDHAQKRIEISMGLEAPPDSSGSPSSFERGVQGTIDRIAEARARTMHQLTYIGEWHSHPRGAQTAPSLTDAAQLVLLREELLAEQRPPVMVIVGDSGSNPISLEVYQ